ncbi:MAG: dihydrofolate reductase [Clostridiales bacterium]|nr:dihydrofolate reductase [Clostridiales bacterium]
MQAIVAVDKNWGIGYENNLLFNVPEDMRFFKEKTTGKLVVMGRKTFLSLPGQKPLPNRKNIVLSRDKNFSPQGVLVLSSVEDLFEYLQAYKSDDIFIIGGQSIYETMLPYCSRIYVTHFESESPSDKFFPPLNCHSEWERTFTSEKVHSKGLTFTFNTYEKVQD